MSCRRPYTATALGLESMLCLYAVVKRSRVKSPSKNGRAEGGKKMALPVPGRVVEALRRSTVEVLTGSRGISGSGTGTVVTEGQVVTNAHVVRGRSVTVASWEGVRLAAEVLRTDERRDLALLSVQGLRAPASPLGDSNLLR